MDVITNGCIQRKKNQYTHGIISTVNGTRCQGKWCNGQIRQFMNRIHLCWQISSSGEKELSMRHSTPAEITVDSRIYRGTWNFSSVYLKSLETMHTIHSNKLYQNWKRDLHITLDHFKHLFMNLCVFNCKRESYYNSFPLNLYLIWFFFFVIHSMLLKIHMRSLKAISAIELFYWIYQDLEYWKNLI